MSDHRVRNWWIGGISGFFLLCLISDLFLPNLIKMAGTAYIVTVVIAYYALKTNLPTTEMGSEA